MGTIEAGPAAPPPRSGLSPERLSEAIGGACARIAPTWPLDRFIAVNPFWGLVGEPLAAVAEKLRALSGARLRMPRSWYQEARRDGRLTDAHLAAAIASSRSSLTLADLHALLTEKEPSVPVRARVMDLADAGRDLVHEMSWRTFITHSVSQFCAAHFDDGQAQTGPSRDGGLYAAWRRQALLDRSPGLLMGLKAYRQLASELPATAMELLSLATAALDVPEQELEHYLWSLLLDQNGWASWCAYRRWTARLDGRDDDALTELLAVRLAWEWLLLRAGGEPLARRWRLTTANWPRLDAPPPAYAEGEWLLHAAMEHAWREPVLRALPAGLRTARPTGAPVQAAFCIDVRSEVFRRALEAEVPAVQTLGFAGFFGLPVEYLPLGAPEARPQLPGLLSPRLRVTDTGLGEDAAGRRALQLERTAGWKSFQKDSVSTFTFVEALGLTSLGSLVSEVLGRGTNAPPEAWGLSGAEAAQRKPRLTSSIDGRPLDTAARTDLAERMLRAMSLTRDFARLVLLTGHGSATRNNPHAAGLDCGACCGQTGEVNARAAAALLNEPEVRAGLAARGLHVPESTWFIAGLHNTTTDELTFFDVDELPASHREDLERLDGWLQRAGARARAERARRLGLTELPPERLHEAMRQRSTDWAQVRPEWGLAGNAAFIIAPREHCRHLDLGGRSFLHDYRHEEDEGFQVLELLMTAPMVVTHWINFQYYASTVDNERYGSGNKVLHNVVGGHLGVFEGNGGDLRIGLPMQSLHDGARWVHEPLRLSVFIEAPRDAIDAIFAKHATVRALAVNGWLEVFQLDAAAEAVFAYRDGAWERVDPPRA
jgi:uncharacterized protein YbcC (UPF0753/DUF2309 family)